jgi:site-specific recombinase XerD
MRYGLFVPTPSSRYAVVNNPGLQEWWEFHQDGAEGLIFSDEDGRSIRYRVIYDYVRAVLERAGVKRSGEAAYQFRHTYAYIFLDRGGSMDQLQKSLGHRRVSTTQEYYDHFTPDDAADAGVARIYGESSRRGPRKQ